MTLSVAHFTNSETRGGAEEHILTLLRGLDRSAFRLSLVCPDAVADKLEGDLPRDVRVERLLLRHPLDLRSIRQLSSFLRDAEVDVLHSHLFFSSLFASPVGRLSRVPVILETPHVREQWRSGPIKSRFFVDRAVGRLVDRYIAVSEANARYLTETKGLPADKIEVIQNGCDLSRYDPAHPVPEGLRRDLGFGPQDPVLLAVGRLEPQKGHAVLLEAMTKVAAVRPDARLVCLGDGALRDELHDRVGALGLAGHVRFVGFQSRVEDWLALCDLMVLPSLWEGLPLAAIESLAAGRAVVASAVDGSVEVVLDGRTGLLVPPGQPEPLAAALLRLLADPELRDRLARQGRDWVAERFTQERQVRQTHALYQSAWEHSRRRRRLPVSGTAASTT